jgi:hypothetical protein
MQYDTKAHSVIIDPRNNPSSIGPVSANLSEKTPPEVKAHLERAHAKMQFIWRSTCFAGYYAWEADPTNIVGGETWVRYREWLLKTFRSNKSNEFWRYGMVCFSKYSPEPLLYYIPSYILLVLPEVSKIGGWWLVESVDTVVF